MLQLSGLPSIRMNFGKALRWHTRLFLGRSSLSNTSELATIMHVPNGAVDKMSNLDVFALGTRFVGNGSRVRSLAVCIWGSVSPCYYCYWGLTHC